MSGRVLHADEQESLQRILPLARAQRDLNQALGIFVECDGEEELVAVVIRLEASRLGRRRLESERICRARIKEPPHIDLQFLAGRRRLHRNPTEIGLGVFESFTLRGAQRRDA